MLQACLAQADVTRSPEIKGPRSLRDSAFNASPFTVALLEGFCLLIFARLLQGHMLSSGQQGECARSWRVSTLGVDLAIQTITMGETHGDAFSSVLVLVRTSQNRCLALRTGHVLGLPVDLETGRLVALVGLVLPSMRLWEGAE